MRDTSPARRTKTLVSDRAIGAPAASPPAGRGGAARRSVTAPPAAQRRASMQDGSSDSSPRRQSRSSAGAERSEAASPALERGGGRTSLWLPKVLYFLNTCAAVPWGRYKTIYFNSLGLTATRIGVLRSGAHMAKLVAWPIWGIAADLFGLRNALLASLLAASIALELLRRVGDSNAGSPITNDAVFARVFVLAIFRSAMNAEWPLVDAATIALVQRQKQQTGDDEGYGKQRAWAAAAWGITSLGVGFLIDLRGLHGIFVLTYCCIAVEIAVVWRYFPRHLGSTAQPPPHQAAAVASLPLQRLRAFFSNAAVIAFLANIFLYSVVSSIPEQVLYLQLERDFRAPRALQGAVLAASVVTEVPVFWVADKMLARYGPKGMMARAQFACCLRLLGYAAVPPCCPWLILVVQLLHGPSFGLLWAAAVWNAQHLAQPGLEATAQSVVCTCWGTLGQAVGSIAFGAVYDTHGPQAVYLSGAALCACVLIFLTLPACCWGPGTSGQASQQPCPAGAPDDRPTELDLEGMGSREASVSGSCAVRTPLSIIGALTPLGREHLRAQPCDIGSAQQPFAGPPPCTQSHAHEAR
eukprot:TRINITY_DN26328_c0_g1_i2.p2 TRINITY_DN26328_c0_g1~~TRINITY_DN26328_c0_g1_i2.p2  ORF type:complete len:603 (+),score=143.68 TRINITY_DN26328_c0_g1_i2:65-1810(+)